MLLGLCMSFNERPAMMIQEHTIWISMWYDKWIEISLTLRHTVNKNKRINYDLWTILIWWHSDFDRNSDVLLQKEMNRRKQQLKSSEEHQRWDDHLQWCQLIGHRIPTHYTQHAHTLAVTIEDYSACQQSESNGIRTISSSFDHYNA